MTPPPQPGSIGDRPRRNWAYTFGGYMGGVIVASIFTLVMVLVITAGVWAIRSAAGWCG